MAQTTAGTAVFRVIDALDHPHGGRILRLRLSEGDAPPLKDMKGGTFRCRGPEGEEMDVTVVGFALFGGRPSDERLAKTGRVDVHLESRRPEEPGMDDDPAEAVDRGWQVEGPLPQM